MNAQLIQETIDRLKYERDLTSGGIVSNAYTIIEPMQFITIMQGLELLLSQRAAPRPTDAEDGYRLIINGKDVSVDREISQEHVRRILNAIMQEW